MEGFLIIFEPNNLQLYLNGTWLTLQLLFLSLFFGALLSVPLALCRISQYFWLRWPVWFFSYVLRGTPLLIQVYFVYYGIAQLEWVQSMWDTIWPWTMFKTPFFCAVFAFTLNTTAYTVEMLAGAIKETSHGEIEAAQAVGLRKHQIMWQIILPSAFRRTLPGYSNEVIMMLHSTSLASVVPALYDLTSAASTIYKTYYLPFEAFIVAAVVYFFLTFLLTYAFRLLELRYLGYLRR